VLRYAINPNEPDRALRGLAGRDDGGRSDKKSALTRSMEQRSLANASCLPAKTNKTKIAMSENKKTVERYMEGFRRTDHAMVLSCVTDDVEWLIPGMFHSRGKEAFDDEIENEAFTGRPTITVTRMIEESDVVLAEGTVCARRKDGGLFNAVFCDVFEMERWKIKKLISYLMEIKEAK
jgi:ketosteroid isomerase-like protein